MPNRSEIEDRLESELDISVSDKGVELPKNKAASECLVQVADFLFENGYLQPTDLPIKSGSRRYLINTESKHHSGDEMFRPQRIQSGFYVEKNFNKEQTKRRIENLIRISSDE